MMGREAYGNGSIIPVMKDMNTVITTHFVVQEARASRPPFLITSDTHTVSVDLLHTYV